MWQKFKDWIGPTADSIKGKINKQEFIRVIVAATTIFFTTGTLEAALNYLQVHIVDFFPEYNTPAYATLMFVVTMIFEVIRRRNQGLPSGNKDQTAKS